MIPRRVRTTDSRHAHPIAPNRLKRDFSTSRPNQVRLADLTYIYTDEGWLYLAAILDMATRKIVGPPGLVPLKSIHWIDLSG